MGLKEFLVSAKAGLIDIQSRPRIHIVIGNESCDLDSTTSAITYAYFLHQTHSKPETFFLPVLNIPREKFRLRLEIVYFLSKHSIAAEDLVFVDDLELVELTQSKVIALSVTLVDHHELTEVEQCLGSFVVELLDHRPQIGVLPESWNAYIERVGSCCTIVARKMLASADFILDSTLAELLLGTILMDTGNMSVSDGVGTPADQEVLDKLKSFLPPDSANSIYEGIRDAKSDLSSLTVLEILYKDLKILKGAHITIAISSVTMKLEDVLSRPEFSRDCEEFCSTLPADVLIIMTLWRDDTGLSQRRIAVYSLNRIYREQISDVLLSSVSPNLELQPLTPYNHLEHVSPFIQNNIQVFRKGVIPLIRDFLAGENTTLDENLNAFDNFLQPYSDLQVGFDSSGEKGDTSEEETRRHINLAKAFQSEQFRTSQDMYDLAAVGMDPVISPSLSSDSELSSRSDKKKEQGEDLEISDDVGREHNENYGANTCGAAFVSELGAGDGGNIDALVESKEASAVGDGTFVDNLIEFGFDSDFSRLTGDSVPQTNVVSDFTDAFDGDNDLLFVSNSFDVSKNSEIPVGSSILSFSDLGMEFTHSREVVTDSFSADSDTGAMDSVTIEAQNEKHLDGDYFQDNSPFNRLSLDNVDSSLDFSSMPTSNQTSGQGSKIPSYPETPPNSCIEPSSIHLNKETHLPSFNSSEMVKRIQEKKAALAGHGGKQKKRHIYDDEDILEGLSLGGENSSGGSGSLISPAVPQNSYVDLVSGFDFQSTDQKLPKLMNSDIMERVNEKRSQFEWYIESLEGSTSGVDVGPNSEEGAQKPQFCDDSMQHIPVNSGADPQIPYTPQNSYVEEHFDSHARSNLPSLNNAEIVARIKAKQSAMFGSGTSSRVSRSSQGSDDSGGCRSPDVVDKSPRGASLDSPQAPYTPQNSYRDNLGVLESRNHLPDLNEVAERLSTENALKHQFGKRSTSNSGGGSRDEEHINLNTHQHSHRRYGRNSSSQSDSQNTMSDVESLMSVSTDIGTPSENIVATAIASHMRNEIALLSRKDTNDSDVFPIKIEDSASVRDVVQPKVGHIDLITSEKMISSNATEADLERPVMDISEDVVTNGYAGAKELFSPFDNKRIHSMEDEALVEAAEGIVAMSVAAAVEISQKDVDAGGEWRRESRLRWNDSVESVSQDKHNDTENINKIYVVDDEDDEGSDDSTAGDISESLPDIDIEKVAGQNAVMASNVISQNIAEELTAESVSDPVLNSQSLHHFDQGELGEGNQETTQNDAYKNHVPQDELPFSLEADPGISGVSHQVHSEEVSLGEQNLADLALNELAFELANELIHSVLDDFPFSYDLADNAEGRADDGAREEEQAEINDDVHETTTKMVRKIGLDNTMISETERMNLIELNVSGNNENTVSYVEIHTDQDRRDFHLTDGTIPKSTEELSSSSTDSTTEKDAVTILDSKQFSDASIDSNSSFFSSERKRSREIDSSMTILENEIMTTFPERKTSAEFIAAEEEEEIQSFPGRKFSRSEDYPSRRFSGVENASRRSSRYEDLELEATIGPDDIETDYLPNMDPLQGNLDIIDASFSKMTAADREVVEGESFRKASGEDFSGSDEDSDGSVRILQEGGISGTFDTVDVDVLASEEESDIRNGNYSVVVREESEQSDKMEAHADMPRVVREEFEQSDEMEAQPDMSRVVKEEFEQSDEMEAHADMSRVVREESEQSDEMEMQTDMSRVVREESEQSDELEAHANMSRVVREESEQSDELEAHADMSTELAILASENPGVLERQAEKIPSEIVIKFTDDSGELETQAEGNGNQTQLLVVDDSNEDKGQTIDITNMEAVQDTVITQEELKQNADIFSTVQRNVADSTYVLQQQATRESSEFEKQVADFFNEQDIQPAETSNELEIQPEDNFDELEIQPTETSNELEIQPLETADYFSELEIQPSDNFDELEIQPAETSNELEIQPEDTFDELEIQPTETSNKLEIQPLETSNELEIQPLETADYFSELEIQPSDNFDELEIQPAETYNKQELQRSETSNEQEIHPSETSEVEIQPVETSELEIQPSETSDELEIQPVEISTEPKSAAFGDRVENEEESLVEDIKILKQKKKIRVSFSEDFDDEIGDFNITSSSRSPLKSPPPLPSSEDSESPGSSPTPENFNSATTDEDRISPSPPTTTQWISNQQLPRKEVYHTSAGRISIAMGEEDYSSNLGGVSSRMPSFTDQIIAKERAQTGEIIESAEGTISEADLRLEICDIPAHTSSVFDHVSLDASQSDLSSHAFHSSHDVTVTSEHELSNAVTNITSDVNVATFDSWNSVNNNPMSEASVISVTDNSNQDIHSELLTSEPCVVTSDSKTVCQEQTVPAILTLSTTEPLTSDPFISLPTHVRSLSSASTGSVQAAVYSDEWQDDDIVDVAARSGLEVSPDDPLRKKIVPDSNFAEAVVTDDGLENEDNETKRDEDEDSDAGDLEWENDTPVKIPTHPRIEPVIVGESTSQGVQRWKRVSVSGVEFDIDMQAVEPFRNVLSHGGYYDEGLSAIIVFYGCNLPSHQCPDYVYIMNHLFHYVIHTLEELVADDYVIIYFHGSTPRRQMPSLGWLKRCYQSIDRRLKKNLKGLFLVHPTLWLRTIVMMTKPFISTKFSSKLRFVRTLEELNALVPLNNVSIPEAVVHYDIHHQHLPTPPASPSHSSSL